MFCTVKLNSVLDVGTVVQFDTVNQQWTIAQNNDDTIGIINEVFTNDEQSTDVYARVVFGGAAYALADREIPDQGGKLNVNNGRVYVDNSASANGIIAPLTRGETSRVVNNLVLVDIR